MWILEIDQVFEFAFKYYGTDWAAMCFTFGQLYFLGNGNRVGFVFGILATISWTAFGVMAGSIANPIANTIFLIMNVRGLLNWKMMGHAVD
ncbi:MAG: PnuC protein [Henriciella sp.]